MTVLIKTVNHENLDKKKKRITDAKNCVHEILSVRPLHKQGTVQN